jgi:2-polyprenyl-3-methyl-5-hydroxy-6-metoxy-1,4-benzoquinol methylase/uncharacterized protein YbaR (Trm112 family)
MDSWLSEQLVCPRHREMLRVSGDVLICPSGDEFPVIDGIPVMVLSDVRQTLWVADESIRLAEEYRSGSRAFPSADPPAVDVDSDVQSLVAATCGLLYRPLVHNLKRYPIPELRLPDASGEILLDIGCGWGRWTIAAARKGYRAVGVDPALRHVLAARRVCRQLGVPALFVVADARHLPFAAETFDVAFSYSVLQHFAKPDVRTALASVATVLKAQGTSLMQMPNAFGIRSLYHQARRAFKEAKNFEVRYWRPRELAASFSELVGKTTLSVDGYFGLGIQASDIEMLPPRYQLVVRGSEALRKAAMKVHWMTNLADSIYVTSTRR